MEDSECSSGCESGWTSYLDNSFGSSPQENGNGFHSNGKCGFQSFGNGRTGEEEEEEEDMSMVSDASSGPPPHLPEEDEMMCKQRGKKQKSKENKKPRRREDSRVKSSLLDDTASSPVFNPPNKNLESEPILDVSKGYSTTQFQGNSAYQEQYQHQYQYQQGYIQYPSLSGNYMQHDNQWFIGRTWQP